MLESENIVLPEPIVQEGYVPTAPVVSVDSLGLKGDFVFKFSEPVFQLTDIKGKEIAVDKTNMGRRL